MGEVRTYTYRELLDATQRFASSLKGLGVKKGDIVTIYLPMIPEAAIAMLACARIGAPHSVVFAGFSADALSQRVNDAQSRFVITCDGYSRRGKVLDHKGKTDEGVTKAEVVEKVIVVKHAGNDVAMQSSFLLDNLPFQHYLSHPEKYVQSSSDCRTSDQVA